MLQTLCFCGASHQRPGFLCSRTLGRWSQSVSCLMTLY
uniref:Uncharacterized protein n=1 Tax=Arundo donax TaxID=35708 RepID=A0A0A9SBN1_ARUDO